MQDMLIFVRFKDFCVKTYSYTNCDGLNDLTNSTECTRTSARSSTSLFQQPGPSIRLNENVDLCTSKFGKNQLEIIPNFESRVAIVKQLGPNDSSVNGAVIGQGGYTVAKDGDVIEILSDTDEFNYRLVYEEKSGEKINSVSSQASYNQDDTNPKPVKIPKMFMSRTARLAEFKKDNLLPRGTWESVENGKVIVYASTDTLHEAKRTIYAFDMDGTIITTKSGKVFPKDDNDWKFLYDSTVSKLQRASEDSASKLVIVTNQAGLANGSTQEPSFKKKIETIIRQIGIPILVFVLPGKNEYRKPLPNIWNLLISKYNGGVEADVATSLYCGDAAGRKKDHSKVDRLFALNIGLKFCTPEEYFLGQKPLPFTMPLFESWKLTDPKNTVNNNHIAFNHKQEMIIMVGYPGSGKSEFVKSVLLPKAYVHINRDTLKTAAKCRSVAESALESGMSVVIDNTNPTPKDREDYMKLARKHGIPCRCFVLKVDHSHALHNNKFRDLTTSGHAKVPEVAFNTFKSKFQEPTESEGFAEILEVNFVPSFTNEHQKALYSLYLLEK
ncbi:unnamed protein product [Allacma fusca]|uniref:Bifunctional polynucleotide phosphatase/kinase n=1 Tax=Allacma fusca TaxID=39272 RepID=A0A8J2KWJ6_9HEXA|nr:unnamed protein product [Allacma fusca]